MVTEVYVLIQQCCVVQLLKPTKNDDQRESISQSAHKECAHTHKIDRSMFLSVYNYGKIVIGNRFLNTYLWS